MVGEVDQIIFRQIGRQAVTHKVTSVVWLQWPADRVDDGLRGRPAAT